MDSGIGTRSLVSKAQGATCWGFWDGNPLNLLRVYLEEGCTFTGQKEGVASKLPAPHLDHKWGRP